MQAQERRGLSSRGAATAGGSLIVGATDPALQRLCTEAAEKLGLSVQPVADPAAMQRIAHAGEGGLAILVQESLFAVRGAEFISELRDLHPNASIIVVGDPSVDSAVNALKLGANDFLPLPVDAQRLRAALEEASQRPILPQRPSTGSQLAGLVGEAPEMQKLYRMIAKVALSTLPVLITGESGTGKELVARAIHFSGPFRERPFIPVDCGSLVPTLIESELFGHVKGAFTGANRAKQGLLSIAEGGTVLLDEVGELPLDLQTKLLRALQEKEIRPVGSTRQLPINVRILAASHRDLEAAVRQGSFRKDLYFRLNVVNLRIPPLRERKQDVKVLVEHFLQRLSRTTGTEYEISPEAVAAIMAYDWPGNVRELENCLERAAALSSSSTLQYADLPPQVQAAQPPRASSRRGVAAGATSREVIIPIAELEKQAIYHAIEQLNGDKLLAAKMLGIGKTTLYRKLKEYEDAASAASD